MKSLVVGLFVTLLLACAGPAPSPAPSVSPATAGPDPFLELRYSCGGHPFTTDLFDDPPNADGDPHPAAAALRDFITSGEGRGIVPDSGWYFAALDTRTASFVARVAGDPPFAEAQAELRPEGWSVVGHGQCRPTLALEDLNAATWVYAVGQPGQPLPAAEDVSFFADVTETECASGRSSEGRLILPVIVFSATQILVAFAVRPLPGGQDCPSNPPTRVLVELEQPVGERRIVDGGVLPAHDPTLPWP